MKISYSSNGFLKYSLAEAIKILSQIGYDGIEIMCDEPHAYPPDMTEDARNEISALLEESGMKIANVSSFMLCALDNFLHPSWIESDDGLRQIRVQHTMECIELAAEWGAACVSTEPGGPLDDGMTEEAAMERYLDGLNAAADIAREKGVRLLIEPEPKLLIENSRQFKRFIELVDKDVVGLNFDVGHSYCVGEDPVEKIKELAEFIGHIHLEDIASSREHKHLIPGEGAIDLHGVIKAIDAIGYDGFITLELYTYQDNVEEIATRALEYVTALQR